MRLQVTEVARYETPNGSGTQVRYILNGEPTVARVGVELSFAQACIWVLDLWRPYAKDDCA